LAGRKHGAACVAVPPKERRSLGVPYLRRQANIELHLIGEAEGFSSAPRGGGSVPFTLQEMFESNQHVFRHHPQSQF
jgi:hypothetical protein